VGGLKIPGPFPEHSPRVTASTPAPRPAIRTLGAAAAGLQESLVAD
jgi:hypothetical protein